MFLNNSAGKYHFHNTNIISFFNNDSLISFYIAQKDS